METESRFGCGSGCGLSAYGTMGQGGNVYEWMESATDELHDSPSENRVIRGGGWGATEIVLRSSSPRPSFAPTSFINDIGFCVVAVVPEPSTWVWVLMAGGILLVVRTARRRVGR